MRRFAGRTMVAAWLIGWMLMLNEGTPVRNSALPFPNATRSSSWEPARHRGRRAGWARGVDGASAPGL